VDNEEDCCQLAASISSIKYSELNGNGVEEPEYPINSKEGRVRNIELCVKKCREYQRLP
jgi:hypothetical protein